MSEETPTEDVPVEETTTKEKVEEKVKEKIKDKAKDEAKEEAEAKAEKQKKGLWAKIKGIFT